MTWYIVVRDTNSGREYLCDDGWFDYEWCTLDVNYPQMFNEQDARIVANKRGGYVVTLKEVTP